MENPRASNSEMQAARSGSREVEPCLENGMEGQTGKVTAEPLLQKVRQRLGMQKNKTKTQSLHQRYKVKVWCKEWSKNLISTNKVQDQDTLAYTNSHPDAQQPNSGLFFGIFVCSWFSFYSPEWEEVLKPETGLRRNKIFILLMELGTPTIPVYIFIIALTYLTNTYIAFHAFSHIFHKH